MEGIAVGLIGMAVISGYDCEKEELAHQLEAAAELAIELQLWVDGKPFDLVLRQVAAQLRD